MRLTKDDKFAFVRAVMNDVPQVDYAEQVRQKVQEWCFAAMPAELRPVAKKYPEFFETRYVYTPSGCPSVWAICSPEHNGHSFEAKFPEKWVELTGIGQRSKAQDAALCALEERVGALINTCTTLKQAEERLPEFAKYLPADRDPAVKSNLPVANTLAELQAAGWPKGETSCNS